MSVEKPSPQEAEIVADVEKSRDTEELTESQLSDLANFFDVSMENKSLDELENEIDAEAEKFLNSEQGEQVKQLINERSPGIMEKFIGANKWFKIALVMAPFLMAELPGAKIAFSQTGEKKAEQKESAKKIKSEILDSLPKDKRAIVESYGLMSLDRILEENYSSTEDREAVKQQTLFAIDKIIKEMPKRAFKEGQNMADQHILLSENLRYALIGMGSCFEGAKVTKDNKGNVKIEVDKRMNALKAEKQAIQIVTSFLQIVDKMGFEKWNFKETVKELTDFTDDQSQMIVEVLMETAMDHMR